MSYYFQYREPTVDELRELPPPTRIHGQLFEVGDYVVEPGRATPGIVLAHELRTVVMYNSSLRQLYFYDVRFLNAVHETTRVPGPYLRSYTMKLEHELTKLERKTAKLERLDAQLTAAGIVLHRF